MTETSNQPATQSTSPATRPGDDPLEHLYKMSRTAGLGSDTYTAVNGFAVATLLFGLGSALVVMNAMFLIVPMIAIAAGAVALYQIRHSNGTQTGRALAWGGMVAALAFSALLGTRQILEIFRIRDEERVISTLISDFGNEVAAKQYDKAYERFTPRFAEWQSKPKVIERLELVQSTFGPIKGMTWNGRTSFDEDGATGAPVAHTVAVVDHEGGHAVEAQMDRIEFQLMKVDGQWKLEGIPKWFPPETKMIEGPARPGR